MPLHEATDVDYAEMGSPWLCSPLERPREGCYRPTRVGQVITLVDFDGRRPERFVYSGYDVDPRNGRLEFRYAFEGGPEFTEAIEFHHPLPDLSAEDQAAFTHAVRFLYAVAGTSYYKLYATESCDLRGLPLAPKEVRFLEQIFAGGLAEFAYRNGLDLSGKPKFTGAGQVPEVASHGTLSALDPTKSVVLIGGGKDSLVSVEAMRAAKAEFALFAVNPRQPMKECARIADKPLISVDRRLDPLLFELNSRPDTYNGHVPITAIVSLIAVVGCFFYGYANIILSNERSADEPNLVVGKQDVNHQYSKTSTFENDIAAYLHEFVSHRIAYFSLLRPLSELHIASLFAKTDRYDHVFTSCNRAFKLRDRPDTLWCGECAKCRFTFLLLAVVMPAERLLAIFPGNLLDDPKQIAGYRELCGLGLHKPWDCVGEELESAVALVTLARRDEWRTAAVLRALAPDLGKSSTTVDAALTDFMTPRHGAMIPDRFRLLLDSYVA